MTMRFTDQSVHLFANRHIGPKPEDVSAMLQVIGVETLEDLIRKTVPRDILLNDILSDIHLADSLNLPDASLPQDAQNELKEIAQKNHKMTSMIGAGYHNCITPAVIRRNILENPSWYTSYTPYHPEISQGRLEALLNFQTMVSELTAMDIANASLLDEPTAASEAMVLLHRTRRKKNCNHFLVDMNCHPQTIAVTANRAEPLNIEITVTDTATAELDVVYAILVQYPGTTGDICDLKTIIERCHASDTMVAVAADPLALCVLTPPGELGADVVVGSTQRFGVPMGFGGPHAAYIAVRSHMKRSLPGRLVGMSVDSEGRPAIRLALQTREQHIRREKATSNICTAQTLLAVLASMYAMHHGPSGLQSIALRVNHLAAVLCAGLRDTGLQIPHDRFFDTVCVRVPGRADEISAAARNEGINLRSVDADTLAISLDETTTFTDISKVWKAFGVDADSDFEHLFEHLDATVEDPRPAMYKRSTPPLSHPIFSTHRSETALMRYIYNLANKDIALNRSMIPLGSCTMKLNAAIEMEPISWPEFANVHPFAPIEQTGGYQTMIAQLERWLAEITGFNAISLQPNSGAQGELAGLLAIRAYHQSRGDMQRDVCLVPSSAHGTNAASAVMAGMKVVVVRCDSKGNIDIDHLERLASEYQDKLSAIMITYPSTHGVFESAIRHICETVHKYKGQVYMDGANLNAMVGLTKPKEFGVDVSHINLHKTFCIPHGGGGPGVGPIGVSEHLVPFLPNHPMTSAVGSNTGPGPVSGAPWGSAGIFAISWMYIRMMGAKGLCEASTTAILNANYVAARLKDAYPILYTGENGLVAHECILDTRVLKNKHKITAEDIAKRLMDYGFHAPTMSFPVQGTLMVEPTESENKAELDRFCDAMLSIATEAEKIRRGDWPSNDNPLVNAPHTAEEATTESWQHPYTRAEAVYPKNWLRHNKYWPPVSRIDNAYGDRNIVCSCPPISEFG